LGPPRVLAVFLTGPAATAKVSVRCSTPAALELVVVGATEPAPVATQVMGWLAIGLPEPSTSVTTSGLSATVDVRPNWPLPEVIDSTGLPETGVTTVLLDTAAVSLESAVPVLVTLPAD